MKDKEKTKKISYKTIVSNKTLEGFFDKKKEDVKKAVEE